MKFIIKTALVSIMIMGFIQNSNAQKKAKSKDIIFQNAELALAVVPSLQGGFVIFKEEPEYLTGRLTNNNTIKTSLGFGAQFRFETGKDWLVTTGVYYGNKGLMKTKMSVGLLDTIHQNMPLGKKIIKDDMQGFERDIYYHVNYHFLQIPVLFGKDITPKYMKNGEFKFSWFFGGSLDGLLRQDMKMEFRGFEPFGGIKSYTLNKNETEFQPLIVNISAIVGARVDIDIYPETTLYVQPSASKQLLFASYGIEKHYLYSLNAEIGISYKFNQDRKEKTL